MSNIYMTMRAEHATSQNHSSNPYYRRSDKLFLRYIRAVNRK